MIMSSMVGKCGSRMAHKLIGCAFWQTRQTVLPTLISRSFAFLWIREVSRLNGPLISWACAAVTQHKYILMTSAFPKLTWLVKKEKDLCIRCNSFRKNGYFVRLELLCLWITSFS